MTDRSGQSKERKAGRDMTLSLSRTVTKSANMNEEGERREQDREKKETDEVKMD